MTEKLKCPLCKKDLIFNEKTGKLLHYICSDVNCYGEIDVYEKEKSNNPKIVNKKIIKGEHPDFKQRLD